MKAKKMLDKAKLACVCAAPVVASGVTAMTVLAADAGATGADVTGSVTSALTGAVGNIASSVGSAIGSIIPIALPLVGAGLVVTIGLKVFKKVSNNA